MWGLSKSLQALIERNLPFSGEWHGSFVYTFVYAVKHIVIMFDVNWRKILTYLIQ